MRVRWVVVRASARARMATVLCSLVTLFAALAVSACTGSSGSPNAGGSASSTFFTAKAPGTATPTSGLPTTTPATVPPTTVPPTTVAPTTASPTTLPPSTVPPTSPSATVAPIGAPSTGGGGTAGLQHVMLFGLGGLAVLAGLASLIYRRRALRDR